MVWRRLNDYGIGVKEVVDGSRQGDEEVAVERVAGLELDRAGCKKACDSDYVNGWEGPGMI